MQHYRLITIIIAAAALTAVAAMPSTRDLIYPYIAVALPFGKTSGPSIDELILEAMIPLGSVKGRIDHMAVDPRRGRLFVAELGNDSVAVIDIGARKVVQRITGLKEPQGVAYAPKTDRLFIANGGTGIVEIRDGVDLTHIGAVALGDDADNIRLDGQDRVIVGYGNGGLAVLDSATGNKIADIPLAAHPEAFLPDPDGDRIFVNEPRALRVAVIDRRAGKEVARWGALAAANFPMALDAVGHRLFVVYRMPPLIITFDTKSGKIIGRVATCGDADDVFYDAARNRIYVICGEGAIAVLDASARGLRERAELQTRPGARTGLFVPELDQIFVAVPARSKDPAEIRIYHPH